jgi:glycosyltransferase involved in cell wall biosynthesis
MIRRSHTRTVCLITHARFPIGEPRAERAAHAAADAGYRVVVIALRGRGERVRERLDGITVWRLPVRHRRGAPLGVALLEYSAFALLSTLWVLVLRVRSQIGVVEIHSPPEFLVVAGVVPKLLGAVLVLDVRDLSSHLWDARFGRTRRGSLVITLLERLEGAACALADAVVTVHKPYRAQLVARGAEEQNVAVVMNSPDESMIARVHRPSSLDRRAVFTVAYHGTITRWYGVDLLIEAVGLLRARGRRVEAVVLGEGDELSVVRELATSLGLGDFVSFSNHYLPIEEALSAVAAADCGVIPNRSSEINRFILPNKLFEYVALGIPVVSARLETVSAHFGEDELTFYDPGDPSSLAEAIEWVMDQRALAKQKSLRARAHASLYSWETNRTSYLEVLGSLLARGVAEHA